MRRAAAAALVLVSFVGVSLVGGCSSSGGKTAADDPVVSSASVADPAANSSAPPTAPAPTSALPPSTTPASRAATTHLAPSTSAASTSSAVIAGPRVERSTCSKIAIRVLPGGASMGQEIAALQFTNGGSTPCHLAGYPTVTLLSNGRVIGRPSEPATPATSGRTLAPGEVAESLLHDYVTNCQAPLSQAVRVVAPGSTVSLVRPLQLRACIIRVDRLGPSD